VACLVALFDTCLDRPVPALADPCDLERKHTECSRVVETVRLELRAEDCPAAPASGPYHRLRVLLGLDEVGANDPGGAEAVQARKEVLTAGPPDRPTTMLRVFRRLAAGDVTDLQPAVGKDEDRPPVFPVTEDRAAVPLARITFRPGKDCLGPDSWDWDLTVRRSLIATSTIQELVCGLAPGLLGGVADPGAGGPRVKHRSVVWEDPSTLRFEVTLPLLRGSLSRNPIAVSSLGEAGWVREDIEDAPHYDGQYTVRVQLYEPPTHEMVRLLVRGTGATPVTGTTGIPLAGRDDGPAVPEDEGHDAVVRIVRRAP
jgi:hypothetical protein